MNIQENRQYFFINNEGIVDVDVWINSDEDKNRMNFYNAFLTEKEAFQMLSFLKTIVSLSKKEQILDNSDYFFINDQGLIEQDSCISSDEDNNRFSFYNVFPTFKDAELVLKKLFIAKQNFLLK